MILLANEELTDVNEPLIPARVKLLINVALEPSEPLTAATSNGVEPLMIEA